MDTMGMINMLLAAKEQTDTAYVNDQIDGDTWAKDLQRLDEKLGVVGLRLSFRPWEDTTVTTKAKTF